MSPDSLDEKVAQGAILCRNYVNTQAGGQIHYVESGSGAPILLLHQTPRSWDEFYEVIQLLQPHYRLIAMDLPGMGASSPPVGKSCIHDYSDAAILLLSTLDICNAVVCGHHTGGVVALDLASKRPELVQSLVLSSTPWIDESARKSRAQAPQIDSVSRTSDGEHLQQLWNGRAAYYPKDADLLERYIRDALCARDPAEGHLAVSNYCMETITTDIEQPILLVRHLKDAFAESHHRSLLRAFPHADVAVIPDGHVPLEYTAKEFAKILDVWMQSTNPMPAIKSFSFNHSGVV